MTNQLLKILKDRVDGMNLVGFFIAGNGKSGRVDKRIIADLLDKFSVASIDTKSDDTKEIIKLAKTARDNQVDIKIDSKDIKKLKLS